MKKFYDFRLPNIADLAKAIAWARRIYKSGNYGRVYIDYGTGQVIHEEFVDESSRVCGNLFSVDVWLERRSYDCAAMNIHRCKAWLVHYFG